MEMNTIIGIVIAVVIMLVGLAMVLRKPKTVEPSLDADLHINSDSKTFSFNSIGLIGLNQVLKQKPFK